MRLRESLRISWRAITGHKLRSSLTTLGVIIGVGSVVVFVVMGNGFMANVLADVENEEDPVLSVQTQTDAGTGFGWQLDTAPVYTAHDVEQLRRIDGVEYVAPDGWLSGAQLTANGETITGSFNVRATIPDRLTDEELEGDPFSGDGEAVVNTQAATAFEGNISAGDAVTATLEDGSTIEATVTGVVDDGDSGFSGQPTVYVPIEPYYTVTVETPRGTTERAYPFLNVKVADLDEREAVQDRVRASLRGESDASALTRDGYEIRVLTREDQIERFEDVIDQITVFVGAIAGISLIVGSIGIANIMIVSVTERTREIGIMKSLGARKRDVVQLFLVESVLLGAVGAVLGVLAGIGVGYLAVTVAGWPMAYPVNWVGVAVAVGIGVGVLSGLYPAWRAARVDPIVALRRE